MNSNQITALHATTSGVSIETNSSITLANFSLSDCKLAKQISTSPFIQTLRLLQIVSSVSGLVLSTLFIYTLKSKNANHLHINVRLSLISLTVGAIFACSQRDRDFSLFVTLIWNSNSDNVDDEWTDACSFMIESYHCGLVRSPILFAIYATILGSIVLAAERTIATIHFQTYELHGSVFVGISLVIFIIIMISRFTVRILS
ncbi:unnamed protein product [Anisakis simplex]|uniref:Serpentine receptor class alpha/beta-14 (inferred by orthology to a C. elegans protein) n=1 Tax=Anisakis simplex TaxID=6269 RepID=A0A0M3JAL7_ANISI|nr:unnamed protein product [Anisakis simplex]